MAWVVLALSLLVIGGPADGAPSAEDDVPDGELCQAVRADGSYPAAADDAASPSSIAQPLRLAAAHDLATGKGIGVAVIDTGLEPGAAASGRLRVRAGSAVSGTAGPVYDGHGTQIAGLIAGRVDGEVAGVAPGAHVVPIRVADGGQAVVASHAASRPDEVPLRGVDVAGIAAGIRLVLARAESENIRVINISLSVPETDRRLTGALKAAADAGILVVAAAGNRPQPEVGGEDDTAFAPGEDRVRWPARADTVLAVTALADDLSLDPTAVLTGPAVDVSAPVIGATTLGPGGVACRVADLATSWAAAEVSGLAALIFERFPGISAAEVQARIRATARGGVAGGALDGAGMVQPVAALTAELTVDDHGNVVSLDPVPDTLPALVGPEVVPDELTHDRRRLRWWALGGGGALVLALLLRPLIARGRGQ